MAVIQKTRSVNLALQGGGAHGAFTWGVLDRMLDEPHLVIEAISGTSAGAMNGAVLIDGYNKGERKGAQDALQHFWKTISTKGEYSLFHTTPMDRMLAGWNMDFSWGYNWFDMLSRILSPYQFNPLGLNPLKDVLLECVDFERLRKKHDVKLFITATHVKSGKPRVFSCSEITAEVLLASACLPFMFQAVEVEEEYYWDGGYMGNPALWPLYYQCSSPDIIIIQINPLERETLPTSASDIVNRLNEITFNASLISQMRAIHFVKKLLEEHKVDDSRYTKVFTHLIEAEGAMKELNASSKVNVDWDFLQHLRDIGRQAADVWLKKHYAKLGKEATVDVEAVYL